VNLQVVGALEAFPGGVAHLDGFRILGGHALPSCTLSRL
jgi:hypothetical protein